jgi:hypothetical protein
MPEYFIGLAVVMVIGIVAFVALRRRSPQAPPLGIVLLLSIHKAIDASAVAAVFRTVTGADFRVVAPVPHRLSAPSGLPEENVVLGGPLSFLVQSDRTLFVVNSVPEPYREAGSFRVSEGLDEATARNVIRKHQAWLSVEVLHPEAACTTNYRTVANVVGEFMTAECLALFHPESRTLAPAHPTETIIRLRSDHPIRALFDASHFVDRKS